LVESIFEEWGFKFAKIKGLAPIGAQKGVKFGEKYSSHELEVQILYLTSSILGTWFVKCAHKNKICPNMAPLGGVSFYIGFFREIHLKLFS